MSAIPIWSPSPKTTPSNSIYASPLFPSKPPPSLSSLHITIPVCFLLSEPIDPYSESLNPSRKLASTQSQPPIFEKNAPNITTATVSPSSVLPLFINTFHVFFLILYFPISNPVPPYSQSFKDAALAPSAAEKKAYRPLPSHSRREPGTPEPFNEEPSVPNSPRNKNNTTKLKIPLNKDFEQAFTISEHVRIVLPHKPTRKPRTREQYSSSSWQPKIISCFFSLLNFPWIPPQPALYHRKIHIFISCGFTTASW